MKPKRLFLHIGHPKTGTTSIQAYLLANRNALRKAGILVPETGFEMGAHHGLTDNYYTVRHQASQAARNDERLRREAARSGCHTVVLSSEGFIQENPARLAALLGPSLETFIIYYIRQQDMAAESIYAQRVRSYIHLLAQPLEAVLPSLIPQYRKHLERFGQTFDPARILVRPFEQSAFHGGALMRDFLALLGVNPDRFPDEPRRRNESFKPHYLEFKRHCNLIPLLEEEHQALNHDLARLSAADPTPQPKHKLTQASRLEILAACAEENAWIARTYLGHPNGTLFTAPPPDDDADFRPIENLPARLQHDILERLSPDVRNTLEFLNRGVRLRLPEESFLPVIPQDPQALQKAVVRRETEKIHRRIARLEYRRTKAEKTDVRKPDGLFARVTRAARRLLRVFRP